MVYGLIKLAKYCSHHSSVTQEWSTGNVYVPFSFSDNLLQNGIERPTKEGCRVDTGVDTVNLRVNISLMYNGNIEQ